MFIRNLMGPCIQAQEEAGDAFKKPVGPCTKPKRRLIEGPCYSTRESLCSFELILALSKWVRGFTGNNSSLGGCVLFFLDSKVFCQDVSPGIIHLGGLNYRSLIRKEPSPGRHSQS